MTKPQHRAKKDIRDREELIKEMLKDQALRIEITRRSHLWFFPVYFHDHIFYETAPFQEEMLRLTDDESIKFLTLVAFRGSAKSTICNTSYALWSVLGRQAKRLVVILSNTQQRAQEHLAVIKHHLETNQLLIADMGPFQEERNKLGVRGLIIPRLNAKIMAASVEEKIRGLRYLHHRPDLILVDDIEDAESLRKRENRDKLFRWFTRDVVPAGDKNTRFVIIGNLVHSDSLLMRLRARIESGKIKGIYKEYPVVDKHGNIMWPGKYPTIAELEAERGLDEIAYQREMMLTILPEEDQVISMDWIQYYPKMPRLDGGDHRETYIVVDPAASERENRDKTAIVVVSRFGSDEKLQIYFHPQFVNKRLQFPQIIEHIELLKQSLGKGSVPTIVVEDVGTQKYLIQELRRKGFHVKGFLPKGDKGGRLSAAGAMMHAGKVFFSEEHHKDIVEQIVNYPAERYDDLVDAVSMAILKIGEDDHRAPRITIWSVPMRRRGLADY